MYPSSSTLISRDAILLLIRAPVIYYVDYVGGGLSIGSSQPHACLRASGELNNGTTWNPDDVGSRPMWLPANSPERNEVCACRRLRLCPFLVWVYTNIYAT